MDHLTFKLDSQVSNPHGQRMATNSILFFCPFSFLFLFLFRSFPSLFFLFCFLSELIYFRFICGSLALVSSHRHVKLCMVVCPESLFYYVQVQPSLTLSRSLHFVILYTSILPKNDISKV